MKPEFKVFKAQTDYNSISVINVTARFYGQYGADINYFIKSPDQSQLIVQQ
jgi:hypothetical protein